MSEMPGTEGSAYPWLGERGEMSVDEESGNGTESGYGTGPEEILISEPAPAYGADDSVVADSTPSMTDSGKEPAVPFLQSLVDAMRRIAEQTREDALGKLRAGVAERSAGIRAEIEKRAAELHQQADADVAKVADWEQGEVQRIREEATAKVAARNATLDAQLAANTAAGEGATTAVEARVEAFEAEMSSFFAQLNDIQDPAALAAALKRIPQAPSLTDPVAASAGDTAPSPAVVVAETEPAVAAVPAAAGEPAASSETVASTAPEAAAPAPVAAEASEHSEPPEQAAPAVAVATAPEPMVESAPVESAPVEAPAVEPVAEEFGEDATTQVLVTGLTSFGAITSFKQSLERITGVRRVALGLGTSGEFIFTAVHRAGFDLSAAIRSFEETAQFVASNGQLRVTVGSKA